MNMGCALWGKKSSILHKIMNVKSRLELAKDIYTHLPNSKTKKKDKTAIKSEKRQNRGEF